MFCTALWSAGFRFNTYNKTFLKIMIIMYIKTGHGIQLLHIQGICCIRGVHVFFTVAITARLLSQHSN
jgi:hypothetical protein